MDEKEKHRLYMQKYYARLRLNKGICSECLRLRVIWTKSTQKCMTCDRRAYASKYRKLCRKLNIKIQTRQNEWRKKTGKNSNYYFLTKMFSGNREKVIQRDHEQCVECGFTRKQSFDKWGFDLTVDHIIGDGRWDINGGQRNEMSNLQTLCCHCHGKKSIKARKDSLGLYS